MAARRALAVVAAPAGLCSLDEAALRYPSVTKRTMRNIIAAGRLAGVKIGKRVFVNLTELDELFRPKIRPQGDKPEPAAEVPTSGLHPCGVCGARLSTPDHRAICGKDDA